METTFISKENGQVLAAADDLIQLIGRKVIVGKKYHNIIQGGIINETRNCREN